MDIFFIPPRVWIFLLFLFITLVLDKIYKWHEIRKLKHSMFKLQELNPELFVRLKAIIVDEKNIISTTDKFNQYLDTEIKETYAGIIKGDLITLLFSNEENHFNLDRLLSKEINKNKKHQLKLLKKSIEKKSLENTVYHTYGQFFEVHFFLEKKQNITIILALKFKIGSIYSKFLK